MSLKWNKIFAAILVAGIVAKLSGFVAGAVFHVEELEKNAYEIAVADAPTAGGAVAEAVAEPILALLANADITTGEKLSKACAACHTFEKGGSNGVGPNLWGVVGADKGAHAGFAYSDAMLAKEGTWNYQSLNTFLWKPKKYVEGTKMNYIGLKKPEQRADLIAWLRTLSDNPVALPSQAEIDAEAPQEDKAEAPEEMSQEPSDAQSE